MVAGPQRALALARWGCRSLRRLARPTRLLSYAGHSASVPADSVGPARNLRRLLSPWAVVFSSARLRLHPGGFHAAAFCFCSCFSPSLFAFAFGLFLPFVFAFRFCLSFLPFVFAFVLVAAKKSVSRHVVLQISS